MSKRKGTTTPYNDQWKCNEIGHIQINFILYIKLGSFAKFIPLRYSILCLNLFSIITNSNFYGCEYESLKNMIWHLMLVLMSNNVFWNNIYRKIGQCLGRLKLSNLIYTWDFVSTTSYDKLWYIITIIKNYEKNKYFRFH